MVCLTNKYLSICYLYGYKPSIVISRFKFTLFNILLLLLGCNMATMAQRVHLDREQVVAQVKTLQERVTNKVDSTSGYALLNAAYYASQVSALLSDFNNSIPPSGRRSVWEGQEERLEQLTTLVDRFCNQKGPYTYDNTTTAVKDYIAQNDSAIPVPFLEQPIIKIVGQEQPVQFTIKADMTGTDKDPRHITLHSNNAHSNPTQVTDSSISFSIDPSLMGTANGTPNGFSWDKMVLELHYTKMVGRKMNHEVDVNAQYTMYYSAVPHTAGTLVVSSNRSSNNSKTQHRRTRTFLVNSAHENLVEKQCVPKAEAGWTIVPESIQLEIESFAGKEKKDWTYRKTSSNGNTCFLVETFYNRSGVSGKLEYHINYDIKRNETESTTQVDTFQLNWGDADTLSTANGVPDLLYIDDRGNRTTLKKGQHNNALPELEHIENGLIIKVPSLLSMVNPIAKKE